MCMVTLLNAFYLMIPAYVANMVPLFAKLLPWNMPMDFGFYLGKERLLGPHKTWMGLMFGTGAAALTAIILSQFYWPFSVPPIQWGILVGIGALGGDALKSFFKRRIGIKAGASWVPLDQIDFTIGALALGSIMFFPGWMNAIIIVVISALGHVVVNRIGRMLGIR